MRLLQCHIENFGKLNNADFDFSDGCTVFLEKNGWGKSTLAAFIRVMFYGFENERVRDDYNNERKRFRPWQGGVYGGSVTFETAGKTYVVSRIFGTKEKDDVFSLRDGVTNLESKDFSSNLGEELFQIDRGSFSRTIFLSQHDCETHTTDSINAKIGNLADNTDDMNNYEKVSQRLADLLNAMSPTRKTGSLYKKKAQIASYEVDVKNGTVMDETMERLLLEKRGQKERYKALKEEQLTLQTQQRKISIRKDIQAKKETWETLCRQLDERKKELEGKRAFFPKEIPQKEEIGEHLGLCTKLMAEEKTASIYKMQADEMEFLRHGDVTGVLSDEEEERLRDLKKQFAGNLPEEKELEQLSIAWNSRTEKKSVLPTKKRSLDTMQAMGVKSERGQLVDHTFFLFLVIGLGMMAAAIPVFLKNPMAGIIFLIAGAMFVLLGILKRKKKPTVNMDEQEDTALILQEEIKKDEAFIRDTEEAVKQYLSKYLIPYDEWMVQNQLFLLKSNVSEYKMLVQKKESQKEKSLEYRKNLEQKKDSYENASNKAALFRKEIHTYLEHLGFAPEPDLQKQLLNIQSHLQSYETAFREWNRVKTKAEQFESSNDMEKIKQFALPQESASLETLDEKLKEVMQELEQTSQNMRNYERQMDELQQKRDEIYEKEEQLKLLKEEFEQDTDKFKALKKTKEYLEQARISFTAKYMKPLMDGFSKYYEILTGEKADEYGMSADIELTVEEQGLQREERFFSFGYRDLTGICMRMALVDAMYQKEKPFLIFDDPFVNLDKEKTEGGLKLLQKIGQEYQVLYFTCHESRK